MSAGDAAVRIAIIGSGPAGSYAAGHLLRHTEPDLHVDLFERLPTPWGLVRAGVAPDHPKIKSVTRLYERTAEHPRLRLFANVELGPPRDASRTCAATTTRSSTRSGRRPTARSGSPARSSSGSYSATDFVGWYNGHPDFCDHALRPARRAGDRDRRRQRRARRRAHARARPRRARASPTSPTTRSTALERSGVREVLVVARRGPEQAAFTNPELLELGELRDADVIVDPDELALADGIADPAADTTARRNVEILRGYAARDAGRSPPPRRAALPALAARDPRRRPRRVGRRSRATRSRPGRTGCLRARATDERIEIPAARRLPRDRLPRHAARRRPVRRAPRRDRQRGRPRAPRRVRRRLGQARPERRDRHQQEGRQRDRRPPARGPRRRAPARPRADLRRGARGLHPRAPARARRLRGLGAHRPPRAGARASRTGARASS